MTKYIMDIETEPYDESILLAGAPEFRAAGNLKDPAKIIEDIAKKEAKYLEDAALSALTASICAIGLWEVGKDKPVCYLGNEKDFFPEVCKLLADPSCHTITFGGSYFDYPFLCRRALLYGFNLFGVFFNETGYMNSYHSDISRTWDCGRKEYTSLKEIARHLGVGDKEGSGEFFYKTLREDKVQAEKYLVNDLTLTKKIAEKLFLI